VGGEEAKSEFQTADGGTEEDEFQDALDEELEVTELAR